MVISSGGVSVGEADYTKNILEELGEIAFWKLAIKPGKPFAFGKLSNSWFCGLPGNPVSATLTFYQLVQPLLAKLSGNTASGLPARQRVRTVSRLKKSPDVLISSVACYNATPTANWKCRPPDIRVRIFLVLLVSVTVLSCWNAIAEM